MTYNIKIQHLSLGTILEESISNHIQFKLFLKLVNGCIETKNDFGYYDGDKSFYHIPYKILIDCVVSTKHVDIESSEQTLTSKIQSSIK